jgi:hypothetical protein
MINGGAWIDPSGNTVRQPPLPFFWIEHIGEETFQTDAFFILMRRGICGDSGRLSAVYGPRLQQPAANEYSQNSGHPRWGATSGRAGGEDVPRPKTTRLLQR